MSKDHGKPIDFDVVREPWQKYELNDNTKVKTKLAVIKIYKKLNEDGNPFYTIDGQTLTALLAPAESRGPPDTNIYTPQQYAESVIQHDVKYSTLSEEWHEYIIDDGTRLRIKTTVTRIRKTSKFDKDGEPVYLVDTGMLVNTVLPKKE